MSSNIFKRCPAFLLALAVLALGGCAPGVTGGVPAGSSSAVFSEPSSAGTSSESIASSDAGSSQVSSSGVASSAAVTSVRSPSKSSSSSKSGVSSSVVSRPVVDSVRYEANQGYLYGVGYVEDQMNNRVQVYQASYIIKSLGARSVRVWVSGAITNSTTLVPWEVARLHQLVADLKKSGIQVIFNFMGFENPEGGGWTSMPHRDTASGSAYQQALLSFETKCKTMAKEFPEVDYWEIGNEWNHDPFLHPTGWAEDGTGDAPFTLQEKAAITTDLMRRIVKGVRSAGNNGMIIMPAMAPVDGMDGVSMTGFLEEIYKNIKSGSFGSTNRSDFFDALAWHPYFVQEPDQSWVDNNNRIYQIARNHGDAGIRSFLTEYGFPDNGNAKADALQAQWLVKAYGLVKAQMPYVESMHYYRLFTDTSRGSDTYGLMNQPEDGFGPKAKGLAFQKMAGGLGDLYRFFMPLDDGK